MLGSVVRQMIAPILRDCPQECGVVAITKVDVSVDSSYATLYVTSLREPKLALQFLQRRLPDLQRSLFKLPRRKVPKIRFRIDTSEDEANRVDELLKKLENL